ncbi:hypothetical protein MPH_06462 [Macrophomina phaseolina MS6]|uniref:Uncharacterized protein n=1 Tax=Macrophomina phaseolina (strain MS6) TaxID=1126212 RepID=K2SHL0_MACPH|nr:hypothetical protein MPH_06462 [Macrophomina phaseolina MS6]
MEDEFEVRLEDDSEVLVAATIVKIKNDIDQNIFETVDAMERRWRQRRGKGPNLGNVQIVQEGTLDGDDDDDDDDDVDDDEDEDTDMGEAPQLVAAQPKEKVEPEVDEDGFTKVVGKKRR